MLGMGALHFGVYCDLELSTRIIRRGLELGLNFIDTAPMYGQGHSEAFIREAIRGHRSEVLIATKVGLEPVTRPDGTFGVRIAALTRQWIRSSLEQSLRDLGTDYVDLYQLHAFDPNTPVEETLQTMDALVREGKVRFIGCSNYDPTELRTASTAAAEHGWARLASLQSQYNLIERRAEQELVPACRELEIGVICNRALARGLLTGKYKPNQPLPEGSRATMSWRVRRWLSEETLQLVADLEQFAQTCGRTTAELAIAWLLAKLGVSVVLAGVRNLEQLESCVRGTEWVLSEEELAQIEAIIERRQLVSQLASRPETFLET